MATVIAPNKEFSGEVAGVHFVEGQALCDDDNRVALNYFYSAGYAVHGDSQSPEGYEPPELELASGEAPAPEAIDLDSLTVEQLKELADEHEVDLTGLARKAEIVEALSVALGSGPASDQD